MSLLNELKRRNVFKVGIAYVVIAWLVAQVLQLIFESFGTPDWVMKTVLVLLATGLPFALFFAWAFEMTPEGLKRESEVDRSQSITPQTGRKLNSMIIGILVIALGYFVFDKFVLTPGRSADVVETAVSTATDTQQETFQDLERSIAVLPLANRSAREEDQFFADGMHDDLLTQLAKISSLKVISRTSVMRYRDTELSIPEIATQLGVNAILEGGVQRSGDQVRINMQLIDTETDEHLWAETYDRQMTAENLFAIQSEITRRITDALKANLTIEEVARIDKRDTENLEALEEYMKGQQLLALRTVTSLEEGKTHFERAIELDPGFAQALTGLANADHLLYEYAGWPEAESLDPAMELLHQALELSPELGEAFMVRGEIHRHREELEAAERDFERALELIPGNATVYHWFSIVRTAQNRYEEAGDLLRRAHTLDPMSRVIHINYAMQPFRNGQDEDALLELERVRVLHPDYPAVYSYLSWVSRAQGDPVGVLRATRKIFELDPKNTRAGSYCWSFLDLAAEESALNCLAKDQSLEPAEKIMLRIMLHMINGDHDMAKAVLDSAWDMEGDSGDKAFAALALGDYEKARPGFEQEHADWFSGPFPVELADRDIDDAIDVALVLQKTGDNERATHLLNISIESMKTHKRNRGATAYGFMDVSAYAILGQSELALDALEECAELGYLTGWQGLKFLPHYDSIRDDPRFSAALSSLNAAADLARKKAISEGLL